MYFMLANNSFKRDYDRYIYIKDQRTKQDRMYDEHARLFAAQLLREPRAFDAAVDELLSRYTDVSRDVLAADFKEFIEDLAIDGFVVIGDSPEDVLLKMPRFTYDVPDVKTMPDTRIASSGDAQSDTSLTEKLTAHFANTPRIMHFQFELTSRCNEKCRHCYLPGGRETHDMDASLAIDILDQLAEHGTLGVTFSGGECLLHKDFIKILQHARKRDFTISILSNVTLLNDEIIAALKEANINQLQASVYSMDPDEHDWVTQVPGSLKKTLASLETLIANDVPVQVSCPTMRKTYKSYKAVLDWAYAHKSKGYTDYIMMARIDNSVDNLANRMTLDETEELLRDIVHHDIEYRMSLEHDPEKPITVDPERFKQPVCGAGRDSMCVSAAGIFYPCSGFQNYPLGDAKTQRVEEVWNGSPAIKKLRAITWHDFPKCMTCEAKPFCSMCMVRNMNETGDIFCVPHHFCDVAFLNKRLAEEYRSELVKR